MEDVVSDYINGRQWFIIWIIAMSLIAGTVVTATVLGFREAGNNRVKEKQMFQSCISSGQSALECRVAISGTSW